MSPLIKALNSSVQTLVTIADVVTELAINIKKQVKRKITKDFFTPITYIRVKDLLTDKKYAPLLSAL